MSKKIVIALGGNALGNTAKEQINLVCETSKSITDLVEEGNEVVISHGNGPQVGMINIGLNYAYENKVVAGDMPLPECSAMSEGYIGYHLQNALINEFRKRNIKKSVVSIVTQVLVDKNDEAFNKPSKPIGAFYDKDTSTVLAKEKGYIFVEDAGRGYRRVVASPKPKDIVEIDSINKLIDSGIVVIAAGGGGIPVIDENGFFRGVPAVIDKDFATAKLAEQVNADLLIILTAIDKVCINYGKENETKLDSITISECKRYISEGQFSPGSMLPKIEAAMEFVEKGGEAIIANLKNAKEAIHGENGTKIIKG